MHGSQPGPLRLDHDLATVSLQYGGEQSRQTFQVMGSYSLSVNEWFALEVGGAYVLVLDPDFFEPFDEQEADDFQKRTIDRGGVPFVRPIFHLGPITVAATLSGFVLPGSKEGGHYALAGGSVGYADARWAVHAGGGFHVLRLFSEEGQLDTQSWYGELNGRYDFDVHDGLLGLSLAGVIGQHEYDAGFAGLNTGRVVSDYVMVIGGVNFGWPVFRN